MVVPVDQGPSFCLGRRPPGFAAPASFCRSAFLWFILLAGATVLFDNCAPSLATLQPAHVAPQGHVQATAGMEIAIPTGTIAKVFEVGESLAGEARTRMLSDAEIARLFNTGVTIAASPPSIGQHFAIAYSLLDRTEIGIRYAGGGWRLGGRYQFLRHEEGPFDLVVGLGVARSTTSIPLGNVVPFLEASDFTRWTIDVPILIGTSRSWFRVWTGPKFLYSRFDTSVAVTLPMNAVETGSLRGHATYVGAQGGFAVGYRHVFLGFELTLGQLSGSANVATMLSVPTPPTDISGFVVYPSFALMGEF
ncbi:MAG: hypothetical protein H7X95_09465 [Deltaproteobacteria bacterium]|nr:hypothetical protein [Deltaproteobacteria bacterium]